MYIKAEVHPGAKKEVIKTIGQHRYEIWVKNPAEQNLANLRVREIIADQYETTVGLVRIISGHHSSRKIFSLPD